MEIKGLTVACFSPTGTTRRVCDAFAAGAGYADVEIIDLTHCEAEAVVPSDRLVVIAAPVSGGHVPQLAVGRMAGLTSDGAPAVVISVYGNRAYEHALQELSSLAASKGMNVIAAATFVGEHSYSSEDLPIAHGRPDADDLATARDFGKAVAGKLSRLESIGRTALVDVRKIARPRQSLAGSLRFAAGAIRIIMAKPEMQVTPSVDAGLCVHCGKCAGLCPSGAITAGQEETTDKDKCIRCCACVKGCPRRARTFVTPFASILSKNFRRRKQPKVML